MMSALAGSARSKASRAVRDDRVIQSREDGDESPRKNDARSHIPEDPSPRSAARDDSQVHGLITATTRFSSRFVRTVNTSCDARSTSFSVKSQDVFTVLTN